MTERVTHRCLALASWLLPLAMALAVNLPWLDAPYGPGANNGGSFLGVFARTWERHGFLELRGLPIGCFGIEAPEQGRAYVNHPPLGLWLAGTGPEEWRGRLPSTLAHIGVTLLMVGALRRLGWPLPAVTLSGLAVGVSPCLSFWVGVSLQLPVMLAGFAQLLLCRRAIATGRGYWLPLVGLVAFLGTWLDWSFAFYCVALWPLILGPGTGRRFRVILAAFLGTVAGVGTLYTWAQWALAGPRAPQGDAMQVFRERAGTSVGPPADWNGWWEDISVHLLQGHGWPLLILGGAGLVLALGRNWRLAAALLTAPALHMTVAASHAREHIHLTAFLALPLGLGLGALSALPRHYGRLFAAAGLIAVAATAVQTVELNRAGASPVFQRLGLTLDEASADFDSEGKVLATYRVYYNLPYCWPCYLESPLTVSWATTLDNFRKLAAHHPGQPKRFLGLEWEVDPPERASEFLPVDPELFAWMEENAVAVEEVPRLLLPVRFIARGLTVRATRVRLFTLPH